MTHLSPEQLLDVADGTRSGGELPHLQSCAMCARQVADLRAAMGAAADVSVPDPSPLFWDHLSARVRDAIADEEPAALRRAAWLGHGWLRLAAAAAAAAALVIAFGTTLRRTPTPVPSDVPPAVSADLLRSNDVPAFDDDPALTLLADLTSGMDWEAAAEAGLVPEEGAVDSVVFALSAEQRIELHRLLQEALAASGA
jgi:hypothetical protein